MTEKIILYTTHCPKCKVMTQKLNNANITYEEVSDRDIMIDKGFMSVPILEVNGKIMTFSEANTWINEREN